MVKFIANLSFKWHKCMFVLRITIVANIFENIALFSYQSSNYKPANERCQLFTTILSNPTTTAIHMRIIYHDHRDKAQKQRS